MYICLNCKHIFYEEDVLVWKESRDEYWGTPCYETVMGCPNCKSDFVETYRCAQCGDWIDGSYIKIDDDRYCEYCYEKYELGEE